MARRASMGVGWALGAAVGLCVSPALGETLCTTVAEFNAYMIANATVAEDVTLTFDVVGVKPSDFFNTKGSLAQMRNTECNNGEQDAVIKVYGTSEPLNTSHPPGTLKLEYGNKCCPGSCGEAWASPNPSAVIFSDGTEQCKVTMWIKPDSVGYKLECTGGTYEAVGDNDQQNKVNQIALLDYYLASGGTTWELPNATATGDQVCFVTIPTSQQTTTVSAVEDVTTGPTHVSNVFPDVGDLAVEAADNEAYLKFVVPEIAGKVTNATLFMHTRPESFAAGDGGEVYVVTSHAWSETTMTWSTKPAMSGSSLGRIGPAAEDVWVSLDLGTAVGGPGTYSFAVVSPPTDGNGTHFYSKEGSPAHAPYLRLSYEVVDADGDGTPDGPDCNDANASVKPGAAEQCNGSDDNCDGQIDEGCPGGGSGGGWGSGGTGGTGTAGSTGSSNAADGGDAGGCALSSGGSPRSAGLVALIALLLSSMRRRRR